MFTLVTLAFHGIITNIFDAWGKRPHFEVLCTIKENLMQIGILSLQYCVHCLLFGLASYGLADPSNITSILIRYHIYQMISSTILFEEELVDIFLSLNKKQIYLYFSDNFINAIVKLIFLITSHGMIHYQRKDGLYFTSKSLGRHVFCTFALLL